MKFPPKTAGLYQAAGLTAYVSLFAIVAQEFQRWLMTQGITPEPVVGIIVFLLAFLISAIVCASIALAYPAVLFFGNRKDEAVRTILWTLAWLVIFFAAFLAISTFVFANKF